MPDTAVLLSEDADFKQTAPNAVVAVLCSIPSSCPLLGLTPSWTSHPVAANAVKCDCCMPHELNEQKSAQQQLRLPT